jgi:hypothetical protein
VGDYALLLMHAAMSSWLLTAALPLLCCSHVRCSDWIDGLETFIKQIMHKGWLGGWLMPQVGAATSKHAAALLAHTCMAAAACGCPVE